MRIQKQVRFAAVIKLEVLRGREKRVWEWGRGDRETERGVGVERQR